MDKTIIGFYCGECGNITSRYESIHAPVQHLDNTPRLCSNCANTSTLRKQQNTIYIKAQAS